MKKLLPFIFALFWCAAYAQPADTVGIKYLKYNNVKFYLGQKKVYYNLVIFDAWAQGKIDVNAPIADSLVAFLKLRKNVVIEVGAHTDSKDGDKESADKSWATANAIKSYLVAKDIAPDRVETRAYGKALPIVKCTECTEDVHSINRRVEVKIVDFIKPTFTYADSIFYSTQKMVLSNMAISVDGGKLTVETKTLLDTLKAFMDKNANLKLELGLHSDTKGDAKTNLDNTKTQAQVVASYLRGQGIDEGRIVAVGYGEDYPLVPCPEVAGCPEDDHNKNRRIELKILDVAWTKGY